MIKNNEESGKGFFLPSARRAGPESPASAFPRYKLYDHPSRRFSRHRMFLSPFFPRGLLSPAIIHPLLCLDLSDQKRPSRTTGENGILSCLAPAAPRKRVRKTGSDGHQDDRFSQFLSLSKLKITQFGPSQHRPTDTAGQAPTAQAGSQGLALFSQTPDRHVIHNSFIQTHLHANWLCLFKCTSPSSLI